MPFPWKTIRKKVPYEDRTCKSDRARKMYTALLEMCRALLETCSPKLMQDNDRMQNFVFSNTSNKSEYSDSKYFYPGEQANRLEAKLLSVESTKEFIVGQHSKKTPSQNHAENKERPMIIMNAFSSLLRRGSNICYINPQCEVLAGEKSNVSTRCRTSARCMSISHISLLFSRTSINFS